MLSIPKYADGSRLLPPASEEMGEGNVLTRVCPYCLSTGGGEVSPQSSRGGGVRSSGGGQVQPGGGSGSGLAGGGSGPVGGAESGPAGGGGGQVQPGGGSGPAGGRGVRSSW